MWVSRYKKRCNYFSVYWQIFWFLKREKNWSAVNCLEDTSEWKRHNNSNFITVDKIKNNFTCIEPCFFGCMLCPFAMCECFWYGYIVFFDFGLMYLLDNFLEIPKLSIFKNKNANLSIKPLIQLQISHEPFLWPISLHSSLALKYFLLC